VGKLAVAGFELKLADSYFGRWRAVAVQHWHPISVCAVSATESMRRICAARAMLLCDPERLPLPVLYHHATHRDSASHLPEPMCSELRRLAPRASASIQQRIIPAVKAGELRLRPAPYTRDEIDDLLWLQDELTDEVLERYDLVAPGRLERRAAPPHGALLDRRTA